jgi:F-type H+-transporting ATPase subunit delta
MPIDRNLARQEVSTYATCLLEAAKAEDAVFEVGTQLQDALLIIRANMRLRDVLKESSIPGLRRVEVLREVFAGRDEALVKVLCIMVERDDIQLLSRVCEEYGILSEQALNVVIVDVTSAVALDDHLRTVITTKLSRDFGSDILLREHVDSSILGGIILSAHGERLDASMTSQLEHARVALSTGRSGGDR